MLKEETLHRRGHTKAENLLTTQEQCPICGKVYTFSKPPGQGEPYENEQHLSGICSNECWAQAFDDTTSKPTPLTDSE